MHKRLRPLLFTVLSWIGTLPVAPAAPPAPPQVVVVVNAHNTAVLSRADVRNIFLGHSRSFPDGSPAIPLALKEGSPARSVFNQQYLRKDETQLRAYWVELIFTGRAQPPQEVESEAELRALVARNPAYIGYLDEKSLGEGVRSLP